jgi:hypothetical protein
VSSRLWTVRDRVVGVIERRVRRVRIKVVKGGMLLDSQVDCSNMRV